MSFFFQHKLTSDSGLLKMSNVKNQIPLLAPIVLNLFFLAYNTGK